MDFFFLKIWLWYIFKIPLCIDNSKQWWYSHSSLITMKASWYHFFFKKKRKRKKKLHFRIADKTLKLMKRQKRWEKTWRKTEIDIWDVTQRSCAITRMWCMEWARGGGDTSKPGSRWDRVHCGKVTKQEGSSGGKGGGSSRRLWAGLQTLSVVRGRFGQTTSDKRYRDDTKIFTMVFTVR